MPLEVLAARSRSESKLEKLKTARTTDWPVLTTDWPVLTTDEVTDEIVWDVEAVWDDIFDYVFLGV